MYIAFALSTSFTFEFSLAYAVSRIFKLSYDNAVVAVFPFIILVIVMLPLALLNFWTILTG